jgi:hypothetical protein
MREVLVGGQRLGQGVSHLGVGLPLSFLTRTQRAAGLRQPGPRLDELHLGIAAKLRFEPQQGGELKVESSHRFVP